VPVYGIPIRYGSKKNGCTVAVGDTFLFTPHYFQRQPVKLLAGYVPTVSDSVCATHWLPYYRCFVGAGVEERAALRILSCARSTH